MTFEEARKRGYSPPSSLITDINISEELANLDIITSEWFRRSEDNPVKEQRLRDIIFRYSIDKTNDLRTS